ncbi:xanthine dehydrogenase family protein molybdopterin-binding subunit [Streptosporangium lutulentum]
MRYAGEPIAVVAAGRRAQAEDGAERIRVEIEPLPPLTEAAQALDARRLAVSRPRSPSRRRARQHREEEDLGEPADDVFATAPVVVEGEYRQQLLLPTSLEARAVLVRPEAGGGLTVWVSHQAQHRLRDAMAEVFGLEPDQVRVVVPSVGGAFGAKSQIYPEYVVVAYLARRLNRPVRWVEDRNEAMLAATRGRGQHQRVRLAADADGTFLAYELRVDAGIGAYPHTGAFVPTMTAAMSGGAYRTPRVHAHLRSVLTTTAPTAAYRGAGRPEAAYAIERTVDRLAHRLGMDPAELRRRNFIRSDQFPYRTPTGRVYDSGDYAGALDVALEAVGYAEVRAEQARRRAVGGPPLGIGMATYVERSGGAPDTDEYGSVEVCADGTVVARCGSTPTGQGHLTSFAQVVASALGIDLERVRVIEGDTREVPYGVGSFGSRSMQVGGGALWRSVESLITEARGRFADIWGIDVSHVEYHEER